MGSPAGDKTARALNKQNAVPGVSPHTLSVKSPASSNIEDKTANAIQSAQTTCEAAEKILCAAFHLLSERGYAAVSMRAIAQGAGVALSQVAYHFGGKEGLFLAVFDRMAAQWTRAAAAALTSGRPDDKIAALTALFKRLLREEPQLFRLLVDFSAQALWVPSFGLRLRGLFETMSGLIRPHLPQGDFGSVGDPGEHAARFILGALYGTSVQIALNGCPETMLGILNLIQTLPFCTGDDQAPGSK